MTGRPPATACPAPPVPPAAAAPAHDASQDERRIRLHQQHPGIHFPHPLTTPGREPAATWSDTTGARTTIRQPTWTQLLDDLENRFGLSALGPWPARTIDTPRALPHAPGSYAARCRTATTAAREGEPAPHQKVPRTRAPPPLSSLPGRRGLDTIRDVSLLAS